MLSLPSRTKLFLCTEPVDMRKSFDGLFGIVKQQLQIDPLSGHLFLFVNKRRDSMKAIFRDGDGFVIWYKRLERGTWQLPAADSETLELETHELAMILRGIDLKSAQLHVHNHHRKKYGCTCGKCGITMSPLPEKPIEKCIAGPGLISSLIVSKTGDHLPIYRSEDILVRQGLHDQSTT